LVTNCNPLKLPAADGNSYLTDVATAEILLRLIQSDTSPKAEPIKLWLAELSTRQIAETTVTTELAENNSAVMSGDKISKRTQLELEAKTGKPIVTGGNYLPSANARVIRNMNNESERLNI
jgi:hypothetical protein